MEWLSYVVATLFTLLGAGCLVLVVAGLPGSWIMLGLAVIVELTDSYWLSGEATTFGWWVLGACTAGALVGEGLEMVTGAAGTKLGGGSKRGMVGAIVGGLLGAIILTPILPIPIVGTLVGALIGTFVGALLAERSHKERKEGQVMKDDLKAATGATVGRLLGTLAKTAIAVAIWITLSVAAYWP